MLSGRMSTAILTELCSVPTAPFAEQRVVQYVEAFVRRRKKLKLSRDATGNLLLELPGTGDAKLPRWVFTAHMDHPGFVAREMIEPGLLDAHFRGYVLPEFFVGQSVRFFTDAGETVGNVVDVTVGEDRKVPTSARLRVKRAVPAGAIGMWDQGAGRTKGGKFYSRVCDDLAGAAAALAMLDELHRRPPASTVAVLLTRAEEEGFIGAIAASIKPRLLRKTDRLVAIECSVEQPYAPQGGGVIIRTGDRTSIFNSDLTYFIAQQADALAKADKAFRSQRALMPGGTCEATVYDAYGFLAASLCVPLGNYHNMDKAAGKIGPEYIHTNDWTSMVRLFVQIARQAHTHRPGLQDLKERLVKRFDALKHLL
jgi:endoglucanase